MRRITFLLASLYCITACNNIIGPDFPVMPEHQIELRMPDAEMVSVYSTATYSENTIDEVWVLVFDGTTLNKKWIERIDGSRIVRNGYGSQLLPQLKHMPNDLDSIICIANVDVVLDADTAAITSIASITGINDHFRMYKGYYLGTESLPMSGGFRWQPASGCVCEMTRAVAKIQVQMGTSVSDVTGNFNADSISYEIYHIARAGKILRTTPISGITDPLIAIIPETFHLMQKTNVTEAMSNVYLPEFPFSNTTCQGNPIVATNFEVNRQCILLSKKNGTDYTYYRLDFYDKEAGQYINIERNRHYLFTINRVRSEGYRTKNEAISNPGSNIEYSIKIDDGYKGITSNGQYAIVANNGADTVHKAISTIVNPIEIVSARIQLPGTMAALASGTLNLIEARAVTGGNPASFYASPITTFALPNTNYPISIMVNAAAPPPNHTVGELLFHVGNITHRVVFQIHYDW